MKEYRSLLLDLLRFEDDGGRRPGCMVFEATLGRTVRRYAEPVLDYDGYSDTKFTTVYLADDGTRVFVA